MSQVPKPEHSHPSGSERSQKKEPGYVTNLLHAVVPIGRAYEASESAQQGLGKQRRELEGQLYQALEADLIAFANSRMTAKDHVSLDACSVVGEVLLDLSRDTQKTWRDSKDFMDYACTAIDSFLKDNARKRRRSKRGGKLNRVSEAALIGLLDGTARPADEVELAELREWLRKELSQLEKTRPEMAVVVYLNVFCELSFERIGPLLGVVPSTVGRRMKDATMILVRNWKRLSTSQESDAT